MNDAARRHLVKAGNFLAKGEEFYRKAGEEILAAQEADSTLTNGQIGSHFNRSATWVRNIVRWVTTSPPEANAPVDWVRGSHATAAEIRAGTTKLLREAPLEQVEQMIAELPTDRRVAIQAAVGHSYSQARHEQAERERHMTDAERREREEAKRRIVQPVQRAVGGFMGLGIIGHLEQATEELRELNADAAMTSETTEAIGKALDAFTTEFQFAKAMLGEESV
jgi:hypothetical protein